MKKYFSIAILIGVLILLTSATNFYQFKWGRENTLLLEKYEENRLEDMHKTIPLADSIIDLHKVKSDINSTPNKVNLKWNSVSKRYYKRHEVKHIRHRIGYIYAKYGSYIKQASRLTHVPENLIISFIFIESNGNQKSLNRKSGATGLMQLTQGACSDILYLQYKKGRLTQLQKQILAKNLGKRLDCILSMQHLGQKRQCNGKTGFNVTKNDLFNPEFNILCGAIYLSILINKHSQNGVMRLEKIVAGYNIGMFTKIKGRTPEEVMKLTNSETRNYISKLAGKNGLLDLVSI